MGNSGTRSGLGTAGEREEDGTWFSGVAIPLAGASEGIHGASGPQFHCLYNGGGDS